MSTTPTHGPAAGGAVPQQRGTKEKPEMLRSASLQPTTFDPANRTVDVVASTGAKVRRYDWWRDESYDEVLLVSPDAVDLTRFENGTVPVLNSHQQWDLESTIGTTVPGTARFEGSDLVLGTRLSAREEVAGIVQDIADGIIRNISVGYRVLAYEVDETTNPKTRTITKWELLEVSFVPVGADGAAGTRSLPNDQPEQRSTEPSASTNPNTQTINLTIDTAGMSAAIEQAVSRAVAAHPTQTVSNGERTMPVSNTPPPEAGQVTTEADTERRGAPASPPAPVNAETERAAIRAAENERIKGLRSIAAHKAFGVSDEVLSRAIEGDTTVDQFRAIVLEELGKRHALQPDTSSTITVLQDEGDTRNAGMVEHLLTKVDRSRYKPTERSADFRGMQVRDVAREILERRSIGVRGLTPEEIVRRAMTTSDLPYILGNVTRRTLLDTYNSVVRTFLPFARETSLTDFRATTRVSISSAPQMLEVAEDGEIKPGSFKDQGASISLKTYGRQVRFTRQALVNDDLGALLDLPMKFAASAARLENNTVWGLITSNPVVGDGATLFHADHKNLAGTGTALAVASLAAAETALGLQKSFDGEDLDLQAKYLLLPRELRAKGAGISERGVRPTKAEDVTPNYLADIVPITDARLSRNSATAWYLAADPTQITGIEYAYMEGSAGLQFSDMERVQGTDGLVQDFWLDFGAAIIDYRAFYKNPGA